MKNFDTFTIDEEQKKTKKKKKKTIELFWMCACVCLFVCFFDRERL